MAIDRERIVNEALALLNEVGIDKLSTRRLAERLGVQQPALYWHFKNKSALLDAVNSAMLASFHIQRMPAPGQDWAAFSLANARAMRQMLLSVRDGARLAAGTRPSVTDFADAEKQLRLYVDAGFTPEEAFHISIALARYVVGYVLEEQGERERIDTEAEDGADFAHELAPFPILTQAVQSLLALGTVNTEQAFEDGLRFFVEGLRATLEAKQRQ